MSQNITYEKLKSRIQKLEMENSEYGKRLNELEKEMISYRTIFNAVNDAILIHDAHDGRILDINLKAQTLYGYTKKEILKIDVASISEGNPPYSQAEALKYIQRAEKGEDLLFEWRAKKKNGDLFWIEVNLKQTILGDKECIIAISRDISVRKQAQQALMESKESFRQIFDHIDIGIAIYEAVDNGTDFIFKDVNPYGARAGKVKQEDHIGKRVTDVYPGVKDIGLFDVFQDVWKTGLSQYHPVSHYQNGNLALWIENYIAKLPSGEIMAVYKDITSERIAQNALKESEQKFKILSEQSLVGIELIQDGLIKYVNQGYCDISGYSFDEIKNWKPYEFSKVVHPDDLEFVMDQTRKKQSGQPDIAIHYQFRGVTKKGEVKWLELYSKTVMYQGKSADLAIFIDITERKRVEKELKNHRKHLEDLVKARTEEIESKNKELETFTYSVSHDLKAPLRGIDGYSRLLVEEHADKLNEEGLRFLENIRNSTAKMHQLIEDLLTFSRMERRDMTKAQVNLQQLVDELLFEREQEIAAGSIQVASEICNEYMVCDRKSMRQMLGNLIDNAIKFTTEKPEPKIEIQVLQTPDTWRISVKDNGIGFDPKYQKRIFGIFQRLHRSEDYPGTGVGLALVKKATARMGGKTWAKSELGQGATFYLEIPKS